MSEDANWMELEAEHEEETTEVAKKLARAAKRDMSPEEKRAQRISFAMGMFPADSTITKKEVEEVAAKRYG